MDTIRPMSDLRSLIEDALPALEATGDDRGLQRAWQFLASVHVYALQLRDAADAARQATEYARAAGWWPPRQPALFLGIALVQMVRPQFGRHSTSWKRFYEHGANGETLGNGSDCMRVTPSDGW